MNVLQLDGFWSITESLAALAHNIPGLLALLGSREPAQALSSAWLLMSPNRSTAASRSSLHRCRHGDGHKTTSWHPTLDKNVELAAIKSRLERFEREHVSGSTPHPSIGDSSNS